MPIIIIRYKEYPIFNVGVSLHHQGGLGLAQALCLGGVGGV